MEYFFSIFIFILNPVPARNIHTSNESPLIPSTSYTDIFCLHYREILNTVYYACSYAKADYSRFMIVTASLTLRLVSAQLRSQPVFLCIDDTMTSKFVILTRMRKNIVNSIYQTSFLSKKYVYFPKCLPSFSFLLYNGVIRD